MLRAVLIDLLDMGITEERIIKEVRSLSATRALNNFKGDEKQNELAK